MQIISRSFSPNHNESFFLFGPRGTGKTTFIKNTFKNSIYINFLEPNTERLYLARPEALYDFLLANTQQSKQVILDEIQQVPAVLSIIHDLIEQKKGFQFILTGSSARKLKRHNANLLAGRALNYTMNPFLASELKELFDLEHALQFGTLPLIITSDDKISKLNAYINLYLKEEIQAEGLTRKIDDFARFLEIISFSHAQLLNITNIARECMINRKTIANYIDILEDLLLAYRLPIFSKHAKRALINNEKFYLFDAGIYFQLRPKGILDNNINIYGPGLEGLVLQHLKAWNDYSDIKHKLSFWRTKTGLEVDFIIYGQNTFTAIEVKSSKTISPKDVRALKAFLADYPMARAILLYTGNVRIMESGILCIPVVEFLLNLQPNKYEFGI